MEPERRSFWILCSAILLIFVGFMMIMPLVPLYSLALGASPGLIGVVVAAGFLLPLGLAVPAGSLVDRYGSKESMIAGTLLVGLPPFLIPLAPGFTSLAALQVLTGLGQLLVVVAAQSFVASLAAGRQREQNFGWYSTFISVGQLVGPLAAGLLIDFVGYEEAFAVSGAISTLALFLVLSIRFPARRAGQAAGDLAGEPNGEQAVGGPAGRGEQAGESAGRGVPAGEQGRELGMPTLAQLGKLLRNPGVQLALLVSGTIMIPLMAYQSFLPAYLELLAYPATLIGAVISLRSLVTVVIRPFMPAVIARLGGRFPTLVTMTIITAVALALIGLSDSLVLFVATAVLMGVGLGIVQPLTMVTVVERVGSEERGTAFGLRLTANRLMQVVGPLSLGLIAQTVGYRAMFPIAAGLAVLTVALLLSRRSYFREGAVAAD